MAIYLEKIADTDVDDDEDEVMQWGRRLEPAIAQAFVDETGLPLDSAQAMVEHPDLPFLRATLDGIVFSGEPSVYESKSVSRRAADWDRGIPDYVQIQLLHNMAVTGMPKAWLAALMLVPVPQLIVKEFERDDEAIAVLQEIEDDFWGRVIHRSPPPADGTEATAEAIREAYKIPEPGRTINLTPEHLDLISARTLAIQEEKEAIARREEIDNRLKLALGTAEAGVYRGKPIVSWTGYEMRRIDEKALRSDRPDVTLRFTKTIPCRRFTVRNLQGIEEAS